MIDGTILFFLISVLVLAAFVGFEVISKVPTMLHTPLMSATNAIHGVIIAGAIIVTAMVFAGSEPAWWLQTLAVVGVALGAINVVGGFAVTERMLQMFKKKSGPTK